MHKNHVPAYNSKTRVHKLIKLCILRDGNKMYLMVIRLTINLLKESN